LLRRFSPDKSKMNAKPVGYGLSGITEVGELEPRRASASNARARMAKDNPAREQDCNIYTPGTKRRSLNCSHFRVANQAIRICASIGRPGVAAAELEDEIVRQRGVFAPIKLKRTNIQTQQILHGCEAIS
jgi:hypothetical protein